ncbi:IS3 family transposase [Parendozoicomonas callyspongiae]
MKIFRQEKRPSRQFFEYIEVFYNRQRKHSSNGYLAPFKYEQELAEVA